GSPTRSAPTTALHHDPHHVWRPASRPVSLSFFPTPQDPASWPRIPPPFTRRSSRTTAACSRCRRCIPSTTRKAATPRASPWGSTLALAYAETHPDRVTELVLRGIFMLRRSELEWFYQDGCSQLYPDAWETYLGAIPQAEHGDLISAYHRRLTSADPAVRVAA